MLLHRILSKATAAVFLCLFAVLLVYPKLVFALLELTPAESTGVIARRAAVLFLGYAVVVWLFRNSTDPVALRAVSAAFSVSMLGLAALGVFEFSRGAVGPGVWLAICVESAIGLLYLRVLIVARRGKALT